MPHRAFDVPFRPIQMFNSWCLQRKIYNMFSGHLCIATILDLPRSAPSPASRSRHAGFRRKLTLAPRASSRVTLFMNEP